MANRVLTGEEAREGILRGWRRQAEAVRSTLGPSGRNVLFARPFGVSVTRDGVSVAKEIEPEDPLEAAGARLLRMAAGSTDEAVGDGTTTAVVLAQALVDQGMKLVATGFDRLRLAKGLEAAVRWTSEAIKEQALLADSRNIEQAAIISLHGDAKLGHLVAEAIERVGPQGIVTFEDSVDQEMRLEHLAGFQWEQGWESPGFVTDPARMAAVLEEPLILLSERALIQCNNRVLNHNLNLMNLLERVGGSMRPLLVVAEKVDGDALTVLAFQIQKGTLQSCCVQPPGFGPRRKECLRDLAVATGGQVFSSETGHDLSKWTLKELGSCARALVTEHRTILVKPAGEEKLVEERADQLRALRDTTEDNYEKEQLATRVGRLTSGAAVIHVAAATQAELRETKDRLQDAVFSARAAAEEGVVAGGGVALLRAARALELHLEGRMPSEEKAGARLLLAALEEPTRQIAQNAGAKPDVVLDEIQKHLSLGDEAYGYNAATNEFEDLIAAGVVDPVKVTRVALEKAASIARLLLTTEAVVCHIPAPAPPGHATR